MHSTKSPYTALSTKGLEVHDHEGNYPPGVTFDYRPEQMYAHSRHNGVVVTQPRTVVVDGGRAPPDYCWLSCCSFFFCWPLAILAASKSRDLQRHLTVGLCLIQTSTKHLQSHGSNHA
ncbi:uncharacterized protein LOC124284384 [Haliotis rubra]|uniref:uncharacterized protein LOC124284384 n=1 Tax=Haliotis rubra TaxID=36100 RepID=UPI001EE5B753|nr:uncharacterized protein LOC124284384 [Haliotis rubra]